MSNLDYRSGTSVTPKFSPLKGKLNPKDVLSMKPPGYEIIRVCAMSSQQSNTSKDKRATFHLVKGSSCKEKKIESINTAKKVKLAISICFLKKWKNVMPHSLARKRRLAIWRQMLLQIYNCAPLQQLCIIYLLLKKGLL